MSGSMLAALLLLSARQEAPPPVMEPEMPSWMYIAVFEENSTAMTQGVTYALDRVAPWGGRWPDDVWRICGHADADRERDAPRLARRRVRAVIAYLRAHGMKTTRFTSRQCPPLDPAEAGPRRRVVKLNVMAPR
ncbi:MAG: hypothetical protein AB7E60_06885 [Sphingobium sp.]